MLQTPSTARLPIGLASAESADRAGGAAPMPARMLLGRPEKRYSRHFRMGSMPHSTLPRSGSGAVRVPAR
jgi:hypothetical protein